MTLWQNLQLKFNAMPQRRRKFWFILTLAFITYMGVWVVLLPQLQAYLNEQAKLEQQQTTNRLTQTQIEALEIRLSGDPQAPLRNRLERLEQQLSEVNATLQAETNYVSAADNRQLLKALLGHAEQLDVQSAQALPAERVYGDGEATAGAIYKHRLQLVFHGNYNEVFGYFQRLEQLPWSFYWQRLDYRVTDHPQAEVMLEIYTLSLERDYVAS
ncbi:hypothetical protein [Pseudidiomarina insulisalsae]|uniref:MSHA biogenesis protein MshJ n=1 Tax=Pseudidiomarina insulisalsae TaxID=575789 RepID=A0A432YN99_9GAMM|nr:hypothetical protein [Pseudidiomarina insulisalsae]RUO62420.1 hypothetical protein CWI71_02990 [Pseudidiomarina insulisalsae]